MPRDKDVSATPKGVRFARRESVRHGRCRWLFSGQWLAVTTVGFVLGSPAFGLLLLSASYWPLVWAVEGLCVGGAQMLLLRRRVRGALWWVVATAVGRAAASLAASVLLASPFEPMHGDARNLAGPALIGFAGCLLQWPILGVARKWTWCWVLAGPLAWLAGFVGWQAAYSLSMAISIGPAFDGWAILAMWGAGLGVMIGAVQGMVLAFVVFREAGPEEPS